MTGDPEIITIILMSDGMYNWDVSYADGGLGQDGKSKTLNEAMQCVAGVIQNGRTEP